MDFGRTFYDRQTHLDSLREAAAACLDKNDARSAFMFADRLCRITQWVDRHALLLRARSLQALKEPAAAKEDVAKAYALDPLDPLTAVAYLQSDDKARLQTARTILQRARLDRGATRAAIEAVWAAQFEVITAIRLSKTDCRGWVAWRGEAECCLQDVTGRRLQLLSPNRKHAFSGDRWHACDVEIHGTFMSEGQPYIRVAETKGGNNKLRHFSIDVIRVDTPLDQAEKKKCELTVVVPLYADLRMTTRCLLALARQLDLRQTVRVILVQDNPDFQAMTTLAERMHTRFGFEVFHNPATLGFARSVNRALAAIDQGDVLLLNSDVVMPPTAIKKLRNAADAASNIGTVTPLSNNGEEVSFPSPFHANAIPPYRRIVAIDVVAAKENSGRSVNLVNGVGFCLYIKRNALNKVPFLPELYERGYFEDVDFCLRVKKEGLRNVCACDVYVGHKGASSFRGEKRALVVANLDIVKRRYPTYAEESAAFLKADPLRSFRQRVEERICPSNSYQTLLVVPPEITQQNLYHMREVSGHPTLELSWNWRDINEVSITASDGSVPQSLSFNAAKDAKKIYDYLCRAGIKRLQLIGPCHQQSTLIEWLEDMGVSCDLLFKDSFLQISPRRPSACAVEQHSRACLACVDAFQDAGNQPSKMRGVGARIKRAHSVLPTNRMASAVSEKLGLGTNRRSRFYQALSSKPALSDGQALGILDDVAPNGSAALVATLASETMHPASAQRIILLGASPNDLGLMASGRLFVVGAIGADEMPLLMKAYDVGALFAPQRWSGFGLLERYGGALPCAYFDWSGGSLLKRPGDLALDPRMCDARAAHRVRLWWDATRRVQ